MINSGLKSKDLREQMERRPGVEIKLLKINDFKTDFDDGAGTSAPKASPSTFRFRWTLTRDKHDGLSVEFLNIHRFRSLGIVLRERKASASTQFHWKRNGRLSCNERSRSGSAKSIHTEMEDAQKI